MIVTGTMKLNSKTDVCKKQAEIYSLLDNLMRTSHSCKSHLMQSIPRGWSSFASKSADEIRTCSFFQFDLKVLVYYSVPCLALMLVFVSILSFIN